MTLLENIHHLWLSVKFYVQDLYTEKVLGKESIFKKKESDLELEWRFQKTIQHLPIEEKEKKIKLKEEIDQMLDDLTK